VQYATPQGELASQQFPFNPNSSLCDIAGVCDPTGRIFGLMPHPEAFNHWTNHPNWTRNKEKMRRMKKEPVSDLQTGIRIIQNAVDFAC
jgi:phosphoribosylformylglycinamidine synthase